MVKRGSSTMTKFIISDHPVTVYNREIFPDSIFARQHTDPDFRMNGTHTYFPSKSDAHTYIDQFIMGDGIPIGTVKNSAQIPSSFARRCFTFTGIQTGRQL